MSDTESARDLITPKGHRVLDRTHELVATGMDFAVAWKQAVSEMRQRDMESDE